MLTLWDKVREVCTGADNMSQRIDRLKRNQELLVSMVRASDGSSESEVAHYLRTHSGHPEEL